MRFPCWSSAGTAACLSASPAPCLSDGWAASGGVGYARPCWCHSGGEAKDPVWWWRPVIEGQRNPDLKRIIHFFELSNVGLLLKCHISTSTHLDACMLMTAQAWLMTDSLIKQNRFEVREQWDIFETKMLKFKPGNHITSLGLGQFVFMVINFAATYKGRTQKHVDLNNTMLLNATAGK